MKFTFILSLIFIFNACNGQPSGTARAPQEKQRVFEMPAIPTLITEPGERANYLAKHYWDKFDFTDTAYIHLPEVTEQAFSNYIEILGHATPQQAVLAIKDMLRKAEADSTVFAYFCASYEKYLYEPNSPLKNEELYISVLEQTLASSLMSETDKIRPASLLELALRNRIGTPATDFTYTLANGQSGTLRGIKADHLLLFFNNPDCPACQEITRELTSSPILNELTRDKRLKVLAVYTDEDLEAWKKYAVNIPAEWINSYDKNTVLKNDEIYDLKAIPTLYLLNKEKNVVLKDANFLEIENYLLQTQKKAN